MLNEDYIALVNRYTGDLDTIEKVRIYVLNHLFTTDNIIDYITYFLNKTKELNDKLGMAVATGMYFWPLHVKDIEKAHEYSKKALDIYKGIDDYQKKIGYLSVLNNEFIYYNYSGKMEQSYKIMNEAMALCLENIDIRYYFAFSINSVYLLMDLQMYSKANEVVNKVYENNVYLSSADKSILKTLRIKLDIMFGETEKALKNALDLELFNNDVHIFDKYIVNSFIIDAYIALKKYDMCKSYVDSILDNVKESIDDVDLSKAFHTLARYYKEIGDVENAEKYYILCYNNIHNLLGAKIVMLDEAMEVFKKTNNILYYDCLEKKNILLTESNKVCRRMIDENNDNNDFYDLKFRFVFNKIDLIIEFIDSMNNTTSPESLRSIIIDRLTKITEAEYVDMKSDITKNTLHGLDISKIENLKVYNELSDELKGMGDFAIVTKIENELSTSFWLFVFSNKTDIEKKEIIYLIKLLKEMCYPVFENLKRYYKALADSNHDQLTQLYNRYGLNQILSHYYTYNDSSYLIVLDIDNFKSYNDKYGHDCGDAILVSFSNILIKHFKAKYAFRIGGEEFICLINSSNIDETLTKLFTDINNNIVLYNDLKLSFTVSAGAAKIKNYGEFEKVLKKADIMLYDAKNKGKNRYYVDSN